MYIEERQIKIVEKALKDYDFIKNEIETKVEKGYTIENIADYLVKLKGIDITNFDDSMGEITYLDFIYNDINTFVSCDKTDNNIIRIGSTLEIYDKEEQEYVIEDWLRKEDYIEIIENTKKMLPIKNCILDFIGYNYGSQEMEDPVYDIDRLSKRIYEMIKGSDK